MTRVHMRMLMHTCMQKHRSTLLLTHTTQTHAPNYITHSCVHPSSSIATQALSDADFLAHVFAAAAAHMHTARSLELWPDAQPSQVVGRRNRSSTGKRLPAAGRPRSEGPNELSCGCLIGGLGNVGQGRQGGRAQSGFNRGMFLSQSSRVVFPALGFIAR